MKNPVETEIVEDGPTNDAAATTGCRKSASGCVVIPLALAGGLFVLAAGALCGWLGGWIAQRFEWTMLGGAVAGFVAGCIGAPYGAFIAFLFLPEDPHAWRRETWRMRADGGGLSSVFAVLITMIGIVAASALLPLALLIVGIPSAVVGVALFESMPDVPPALLGVGLALTGAGLSAFLTVMFHREAL